ncbi:hypothetical protein G9C98_008495, partial [Cotesia typhae]
MRVLPESFLVLQLFAGWVPLRWSLTLKEKIYNLYTLIIEMILVTFCISCIVDLFLTKNIDDIVHAMSMAFTIIAVIAKLTLMTVKRNAILQIFRLLKSKTCIIKSDEEAQIQLGYDKRVKNITKQYGRLVCVAVVAISGASMIENVPTRTLPISGWFPYQHSNSTGYWFAYCHQIIALSYGGMIGLSFDTIAFGVMIQNSSQLRILKHRLENFTQIITKHRQQENITKSHFSVRSLERKVLEKLINHHQVIIQYSRLSNDVFSPVIFVQYSLSSLILCMCVQSLTKLAFMGPEFVFLLVFLSCMLMEIYLYCWYGNEVMLESVDLSVSIYKMNWYFLTNECKKDLLMMKKQTLKPIKYTSGTLIELSLDSFTN